MFNILHPVRLRFLSLTSWQSQWGNAIDSAYKGDQEKSGRNISEPCV